jgi:hypothetical protein
MLRINISPDAAQTINFNREDDPKTVSRQFCLRQNLSEQNIGRITEILESRRALALKEERLVGKLGSPYKTTTFVGSSDKIIEESGKITAKKERPTFGGKNNKNFANIQNFNTNNAYNYNHNNGNIKLKNPNHFFNEYFKAESEKGGQNPNTMSANIYESHNSFQGGTGHDMASISPNHRQKLHRRQSINSENYNMSGRKGSRGPNDKYDLNLSTNIYDDHNSRKSSMAHSSTYRKQSFAQRNVSLIENGFSGSIDNGKKLLMKHLKLKETVLKKDRMKYSNQSQRDHEERIHCTFKPRLCKNSLKIIQDKSYLSVEHDTEKNDHDLYGCKRGSSTKNVKLMNPKMRQYEEEKYIECSFRPSVNMISDQIIQVKRSIENPELSSSRNAHVNVHDSLYLQAGVLAEKKKQTAKDFIRQNYSFRPKLSKTSIDNFSSSSYRSLNFLQRQELARASKQKKL